MSKRIIHSMECTQIPSHLPRWVRPSLVGTDELDATNQAEWIELAFSVLRAVLVQPSTLARKNQDFDDIRHLQANQEFCGVMGCFIEIPSIVEEKNVTSLQADHRNTPYFPTSITTRKPR